MTTKLDDRSINTQELIFSHHLWLMVKQVSLHSIYNTYKYTAMQQFNNPFKLILYHFDEQY